MNTNKTTYYLAILLIVLSFISCNNDDGIQPANNNTAEYFKYTLDGNERVFEGFMNAYYVANPDPNFEKFTFRAGANTTNGGSIYVDGDFTFPNYSSFVAINSIPWGFTDTTNTTFYFSEFLSDDGFSFIPHHDYAFSIIDCTITQHAPNVGDYLEFAFTGTYALATDSSVTGTILGSARMLRDADQ